MIAEYGFGAWLPDQIDYKSPNLNDCKNTIPSTSGYQPALAMVATDADISALTVLGAFGFRRLEGEAVTIIATATDLHVVVGSTVTASGLSFLGGVFGEFSAAQFGASIIVTAKSIGTWILGDLEADTTFAAATIDIPTASSMGRVADFMVMGDLIDIDAADAPYRIRWSRFNDPFSDWDSEIAYQSGAVDLRSDQGPVTAISGGEFGVIFQRDGISRLTYTGGGSVFAKELFEKNRGCPAPRSIARVGNTVYFASYDGFFTTDGDSVTAISQGKLWRWVRDALNETQINEIQAVVDWENRCVIWALPLEDATASGYNFTRMVYYNWETTNWSYVDAGVDWMFPYSDPAVSFDDLAGSPDDFTISPDSAFYKSQGRTVAAISDGAINTFAGASLEATFETTLTQASDGNRTFVRSVTPIIVNNDENTTVSVGTVEGMTKPIMFPAVTAIGSLGFAPVIADGRYHSIRVVIPAGANWSDAAGYQLDFDVSGQF